MQDSMPGLVKKCESVTSMECCAVHAVVSTGSDAILSMFWVSIQ